MIKLEASLGKMEGFGLIRDKDGKPKIDNYEKLPAQVKALLTPEERKYFEQRGK